MGAFFAVTVSVVVLGLAFSLVEKGSWCLKGCLMGEMGVYGNGERLCDRNLNVTVRFMVDEFTGVFVCGIT